MNILSSNFSNACLIIFISNIQIVLQIVNKSNFKDAFKQNIRAFFTKMGFFSVIPFFFRNYDLSYIFTMTKNDIVKECLVIRV